MGKKSTPTPPPPPDPRVLAETDAEFNRIDQFTPYGNLEYSGDARNIATLTLPPELQQLFDSQTQSDQNLLTQALQRQQGLDPNPIDLSQFGDIQTEFGDSSGINFNQFDPGQLQGLLSPDLQQFNGQANLQNSIGTFGVPDSPNLQSDIGQTLGIQSGVDPLQVQRQLDLTGVGSIPQDIEAYRGDVESAFFDRQRALLDPLFADQQNQLTSTLANRGLPDSGAAVDTATQRFQDSRGRAYTDAARNATLTAGSEASRQLGDVLASQGQRFGQSVAGGQFANNATGQQFGQNLAAGQFGNNAAAQDFSQAANRAGFANNAGLQGFNADLQGAQFGLGQNLAAGQFANQANQQEFQNQLGNTAFNNQTGLQQLAADQGIRQQQFGEAAQTQQFNDATSNQNLALQQLLLNNNNQGRAQSLAEQQGIRGTEFNELMALLGMQQVQPNQLSDFYTPGQVNTLGAQGLSSDVANQNYQAQLNDNAAGLSGLFGLGGSILGGPIGGAIGSGLGSFFGGTPTTQQSYVPPSNFGQAISG